MAIGDDAEESVQGIAVISTEDAALALAQRLAKPVIPKVVGAGGTWIDQFKVSHRQQQQPPH